MSARSKVDAARVREVVVGLMPWLAAGAPPRGVPARAELAEAVRGTTALLALEAPGHAVELRVPPFAAVQCIAGPRHTRGTPPNVVETDPATWLLLATGRMTWDDALAGRRLTASGTRAAEIARALPVIRATA